MKKIRSLLVLIIWFICTATHACEPLVRAIPHFIRRTARYTPNHREELLAKLQKAFLQKQRTQKMLQEAFEVFEETPGFVETAQSLFSHRNSHTSKGYRYEIEKALALHNAHCTCKTAPVVRAFSQITASPRRSQKREFDIVALIDGHYVLYECKNIRWDSYPYNDDDTDWDEAVQRIVLQFNNQQEIVEDLSEHYSGKFSYIVTSKKTIPPKWKKWFEQQGIETEEDS